MPRLEQTDGIVLSASIGSGQSRSHSESGGYRYRTSYYPNVTYQYTVNSQQYTNNTYAQRPSLISNQMIIQRILSNYPVGSSVKVYYNPENPQEAYLQKGYSGAVNVMLIAVALLIVIFFTVILFVALATSA